jgi:phosphoribosyl-dephospho-CoA transferase
MAENTEKKEVKTKKAPAAKAAAKKETTATKKASTAKTSTPKTTAAKKPAAKKTKAATSDLEQRYKLIELAAYYIAEKDGFAASPVDYWIAAELQFSK